jgi:hypothetical protein
MTLHLRNISFVAVPKTATIAVEKAFSPYARDYVQHRHDPVDIVKRGGEQDCLGIIRNPHDWILSYYLYLKHSPYFYSLKSIWGIGGKSFEQFVGRFCDGQHLWPEPLRLQSMYLLSSVAKTDFIYRYEHLSDAVSHISAACGERPTVGRCNVSQKEDVKLSKKMAFLFEAAASKDFELYESTSEVLMKC